MIFSCVFLCFGDCVLQGVANETYFKPGGSFAPSCRVYFVLALLLLVLEFFNHVAQWAYFFFFCILHF